VLLRLHLTQNDIKLSGMISRNQWVVVYHSSDNLITQTIWLNFWCDVCGTQMVFVMPLRRTRASECASYYEEEHAAVKLCSSKILQVLIGGGRWQLTQFDLHNDCKMGVCACVHVVKSLTRPTPCRHLGLIRPRKHRKFWCCIDCVCRGVLISTPL